jgi:hypothetical protein
MSTADQWPGVAQGVQDNEGLCVWPAALQEAGAEVLQMLVPGAITGSWLLPASASRAQLPCALHQPSLCV